MKKIGSSIDNLVFSLAGDSDQARINYRARQVRDRYRKAIEAVYKDNAGLFLAHTNNVYIFDKGGIKTLVSYVDDSLYASELNAQRELIRLKLLELFGEKVEQFDIHVSRGNYKKHHPFLESDEGKREVPPLPDLDRSELDTVKKTAANVEDKRLRESFEKAMTADLARKKSK